MERCWFTAVDGDAEDFTLYFSGTAAVFSEGDTPEVSVLGP